MNSFNTLRVGVAITLLVTSGTMQAGVVNGSFESWDFVGWTLQNDVGNRTEAPFTRPAGVARTAGSWGESIGLSPLISPLEGHRFLQLNSRANGNFLGADSYDFSLSQTVSLNIGEFVSGWSLFYNGDAQPLDSAWVHIRDQGGNVVATPWVETSGVPSSSSAIGATSNWTQWQWAVPSPGNYTIQLGMTTSGANNDASVGLFDGISVQAIPVPEPGAMALGLVGGLLLVLLRNRIC